MNKPGNQILSTLIHYMLQHSEFDTLEKLATYINNKVSKNITGKHLHFYVNMDRPATAWLIKLLTTEAEEIKTTVVY